MTCVRVFQFLGDQFCRAGRDAGFAFDGEGRCEFVCGNSSIGLGHSQRVFAFACRRNIVDGQSGTPAYAAFRFTQFLLTRSS